MPTHLQAPRQLECDQSSFITTELTRIAHVAPLIDAFAQYRPKDAAGSCFWVEVCDRCFQQPQANEFANTSRESTERQPAPQMPSAGLSGYTFLVPNRRTQM